VEPPEHEDGLRQAVHEGIAAGVRGQARGRWRLEPAGPL
jgi:hypothetical protein